MTAIYCQVDNVKTVLQLSFKLDTSTIPSKDDVTFSIENAQDQIDFQTQHAWRAKQVNNEFYDLLPSYISNHYGGNDEIVIPLRHREIKGFDTNEGDKIEIWNGSDYENWGTAKVQGRANDWWLEHERGELHLKYFYPFFRDKALRLSYRYGGSAVPNDIRKATTFLSAIDLLQNDDRSALLAETGDSTRLTHLDRINRMQSQINKILEKRTEIIVI